MDSQIYQVPANNSNLSKPDAVLSVIIQLKIRQYACNRPAINRNTVNLICINEFIYLMHSLEPNSM